MLELNQEAAKMPLEFTAENIALVRLQLNSVMDDLVSNASFFIHLFSEHPEMTEDYGIHQMESSQRVKFLIKAQAKIIKAVDHILKNSESWESQEELIRKLGQFHG